jgi:predicted outer membrane repeat protein
MEVINSNDSGKGSLRYAIDSLNENKDNIIILTSLITKPIILISELIVKYNVKIVNKSDKKIYIKSELSRIFHLTDNVKKFEIIKTILIGKTENNGGVILSESIGEIILKYVIIKNSIGKSGGAIYTNGSLIIIESILKKIRL